MDRKTKVTATLGVIIQVASCLQTFARQPSYTEVNPGQSAVLHCNLNNKAGQCSWQKDNLPVGQEQNKYEWVGSPELGDCSLRILRADLKYDDGLWSCQVTASSFQAQDALKSAPARLVVRVRPKIPQIEYDTQTLASGQNLTARAGQKVDVQCRARYGNPPASIRWYIGESDLTHLATQENRTELDNPRTSVAVSILKHSFSREQSGSYLRCVALHEAYDTKSADTIARLNLQYAPEVTVTGRPDGDVEEGVDTVVLRCDVDANPPASVLWKFVARDTGQSKTFYEPTLEFRPVSKENSGTYQCEAGNSVGTSDPLSIILDVKYAPRIVSMEPQHQVTVGLHNATELTCLADGRPTPSYEWLQISAGGAVQVRATDRVLHLKNVTYSDQGQYACVARSTINGNERRVQSDQTVEVNVVGGPQIQQRRDADAVEIEVEQGEAAVLEMLFCSDPRPSSVIWQWGGVQLPAGQQTGRYRAQQYHQVGSGDCYVTELQIDSADASDQRQYELRVQNERGVDRRSLALKTKEPVTMTTVIGIVCGCLLLLVLVAAILLHAFRRDKWCFTQKGGFKPTDLESEKSELDSRGEGSAGSQGGLGAIPPDALYTGPKKHAPHGGGQYVGENDGSEDGWRDGGGVGVGSGSGGIIYADLQLPKTSNNGSMRKQRRGAQRSQPGEIVPRGQGQPPEGMDRTEYAQIRFVPRTEPHAGV